MSWNEDGSFGGKPPDPAEMLNQLKERMMGSKLPSGLIGAVVVVALAAWLGFGGFYIVNPDEVGVVLRFGKYAYTTGPGPHWHVPYPVEKVLKPQVTQVRRVEVGFRTVSAGPPARYQKVPAESNMLTKDENIVSCEFIIQYRVKDAMAFLFNVRDPETTVRDAAEAAVREVVGRNSIDDVLTENKGRIQVESAELLRAILDSYEAGVQVDYVKLQDVYPPDPVIGAFRDVASAREDRERLKNEAEAYFNDVVPRAEGEREKMLRDAEGYRETKIKSAEGDVARFEALLAEYRPAKEVTRRRLYLEAMEGVLSQTKIVLDEDGGVLPVLPLGALGGKEVR
jgi:membrane protease subunit HflK